MRIQEIMDRHGESLVDGWRRRRAEELLQKWPTVEPGMFVQLMSWFGDVWAEITSVGSGLGDPIRFSNVSFYRYEKYGVSRQLSNAYYGDIRKFATRDEIDFKRSIVYTPTHYYSHGNIVEWPAGVRGKMKNNYELHPTLPQRKYGGAISSS